MLVTLYSAILPFVLTKRLTVDGDMLRFLYHSDKPSKPARSLHNPATDAVLKKGIDLLHNSEWLENYLLDSLSIIKRYL